MRKFIYVLCTIALLTSNLCAQTGPLILTGPEYYQLTAISPNGKWACGAYSDASSTIYAFRWDLTTNEFTPLTSSSVMSTAYAVSDNGVVVGTFPDTESTENHAPVQTAGYWKDGKWYHLETIDGEFINNPDYGGQAFCISADGHRIGGALYNKNNKYMPVTWTDGKLDRVYGDKVGIVYDISNDGKMVCGWAEYPEASDRSCCIWDPEPHYITKIQPSPWSIARSFSPDGKSVLCKNFIYNLETGDRIKVPYTSDSPKNFELFSLIDNNVTIGYEQPDEQNPYGIIYKDGSTQILQTYLESKGVKFQDNLVALTQGVGISDDGNTIIFMVYNQGEEYLEFRPMVVKLNENITTREPVAAKSIQLDGIHSVHLTWNAPLANAEGVTAYNIYRNGTKISSVSSTTLSYLDTSLSLGKYNYEITASYNQTESVKSAATEVEVKEGTISAPRNLYAAQSGLNDVRLGWDAPVSNRVAKSYFEQDDLIEGFGGGNISFESAIRFPKEKITVYANDFKITNFVFYPLTQQEKWTISIYKGKEILYTEDIDNSKLTYGKENNIKLKNPVSIPTDNEVTLRLFVKVNNPSSYILGMVYGKKVIGYSDLVRQESESELYSLYEEAQNNPDGAYDFSISWAIGMLLTKNGQTDDADKINYYNIYANDKKIGQTENTSYIQQNVSDGTYIYGIEAVYANNTTSSKTSTEIAIKKNENSYKAITNVKTNVSGNQLTATWETPVNDDETFMTYAGNIPTKGMVGLEANNYNYMLGAVYRTEKLNKYIGYQIKGFRFYPLSDADFTFILKVNNEMVCEQGVNEYTKNAWNTVMLSTPITIEEGKEYFLIVDCYDVTPKTGPVALDSYVPFDGESNLYSTNQGESFLSVYNEASANGNWMIGMVITSPEATSLPIKGYNVEIDGVKKNNDLLTETKYEQTFESEKLDDTHKINVNVVYDVVGEKKGSAVFFTINPTSIDNKLIPLISVYPNPATSYVKVDGNVESIVAYNTNGTEIARSNENALDVSNFQPGLYILKIIVEGKVISAKVNITR